VHFNGHPEGNAPPSDREIPERRGSAERADPTAATKGRPTMKTRILFAAVALSMISTASMAACPGGNGIGWNGLTLNGLTLNGLGTNALHQNALHQNALNTNAISWNALSLNGLGSNALTQNAFTSNALTGNALRPNALRPNAVVGNAVAPSAGRAHLNGFTIDSIVLPDGTVAVW
jgi:hypothetical protein